MPVDTSAAGRQLVAAQPRCRGRLIPMMRMVLPALALAAAGKCAVAATQREETRPPALQAPPSHRRMLQVLAEIARRTGEENSWLGDRRLKELRATLESLPPDAPPQARWQLYQEIGQHELRMGHPHKAVEALTSSREIVRRPPGQTGMEEMLSLYHLGLSYLVLAENRNCVANHNADSCILPIRGGGIHVDKEGSKNAIAIFEDLLAMSPPDDISVRWLLNLAYMTLGQWPGGVPERYRIPEDVFDSDQDFPRFVDIAARVGLNTFNLAGGTVVEDFDHDGFLDVVITDWDPRAQMRYFRNAGDGTFRERTEEAGLKGIMGGLNMTQADYDNDGNVDILVLRGAWWGEEGRHPNSLLRNDGAARFTDVTFAAGIAEPPYPTQTAGWADYDNDGDLDLYVGNEAKWNESHPCQLFRNAGDGTFEDVAWKAGVVNGRWAKGVAWGDYDDDGWMDLYVSNLHDENRLYHNNRDGTFTDLAGQAGVTRPMQGFPVWFWDYDNDGALDIYAAAYGSSLAPVAASYLGMGLVQGAELAALYRGDGRGGFEEMAARRGLDKVTLPMGSNFGDLDNDGFLDFYLGTGYPRYDGLMPNVMYRNAGGRFMDVTTAGGFGHLQKGHGVAFADLDNDGDQDVFSHMGGAYPGDAFANSLFENPGSGHHWIKVKLVGVKANRGAIGARIRLEVVEDRESRTIYKHANSGGSFGANPIQRLEIGLGKAERIRGLEVRWPGSGLVQTFRDLSADRFIRITEGDEEIVEIPLKRIRFDAAP